MVKNILIDFDSTIISCEIMEFLFELALAGRDDRDQTLKKVREITAAGMNGEIPFSQSLARRIALLPLSEGPLNLALAQLRDRISPSFVDNLERLKSYNLHILSGAFSNLIVPLMEPYGVEQSRIHANRLLFDQSGRLTGVDSSSPLAHDHGKVEVTRRLQLDSSQTIVVGDGCTDYEVKQAGLAKSFIYYAEHVMRPKVQKLADATVFNFAELVQKISAMD